MYTETIEEIENYITVPPSQDFQLKVLKTTATGKYAQFESIIKELDRKH
jgi:hypothetical protein